MTATYYSHQMRLLPTLMAMSARGILVNDTLRLERIAALGGEAEAIRERVLPIVEGVKERLKEKALLWDTKRCIVCHNGKKKKLTCAACGGAGKHEVFTFNLASGRQLADVLYNGLKLPHRSHDGHTTTDEEALKSLLSYDKSGFAAWALRFAKLSTMGEYMIDWPPQRMDVCALCSTRLERTRVALAAARLSMSRTVPICKTCQRKQRLGMSCIEYVRFVCLFWGTPSYTPTFHKRKRESPQFSPKTGRS